HQGDRNAPGRHAAEEAGSAVDRIDHPDRLSRLAALAGAGLLTQETVFWKTLLQLAADQLLDFLIGDRDNVLQPLALHGEFGAALVIVVGEAPRLARQALDEGIAVLQSALIKHRDSVSPKGITRRVSRSSRAPG